MDISIIQQVKIQARVLVPLGRLSRRSWAKSEQMRSCEGP